MPEPQLPWAIRSLTEEDGPLLLTATVGNVNWCGERLPSSAVAARPELRHYTVLVRSRGDFGLVAEAYGEPVGVVWLLFLPADDPGYGFVDGRTPELSIWVELGHRGRGLGRALLGGALGEARRQRIETVSLSVEHDNPAKHLYRAFGFAEIPGREADGVMVCRL